MSLEIKVVAHEPMCMPEVNPKGDWIDLRAAEDVEIKAPVLNPHNNQIEFHTGIISLGVSMSLPEGYEAIVAPRSSTFKNFGVIIPNSIGVIDNTYSGTDDVWRFPFIGMKSAVIKKGDRVCQFRIQKSQMSQGVSFEKVESLSKESRGGFGSTGVN